MGVLAYNLLYLIREFFIWREEVKRAIDRLINRLIKSDQIGGKVFLPRLEMVCPCSLGFSSGAPLSGR